MDFIAIDFETANEQRNSACAIGIAVVDRSCVARTYHHLIRPHELRFTAMNTRIHGINSDAVERSPTLNDLWPTISPLFHDRLVFAHNASFDLSVLRHSLHANGLAVPELQYSCSLKLARVAWPELASHGLSFLAASHGLELDHHDAESDATVASEIVLRIAREQDVDCPFRLAEALGVSIGRIFHDGNWVPSATPNFYGPKDEVEFTIPDGYDVTTHPLFGKTVSFTGTLQHFKRSQAFEIVEKLGGKPRKGVTQDTDLLVAGFQDIRRLALGHTESSSFRKARALRSKGHPIEILTDEEFQQCIHDVAAGGVQSDIARKEITHE